MKLENVKVKTIIIQAGGRGSRMGHLTDNKPKLLIPFKGKTPLHYLLESNPEANFIIIASYQKEVLNDYIDAVISPNYTNHISVIETDAKGTCAGLSTAKHLISHDNPIALIWSDLIIYNQILHEGNIQVFVTSKVECRYSLINGKIEQKPNLNKEYKLMTRGIFGLFTFKNKTLLPDDNENSFVGGYLVNNQALISKKIFIHPLIDIGTKNRYFAQLESNPSRYFNDVKINKKNETVTKKCTVAKFSNLIEDEINWYEYVRNNLFRNVPKIHKKEPLTIDYIKGTHPHEKVNFGESDLIKIIDTLHSLHEIGSIAANESDNKEVYLLKTLNRVDAVKKTILFYDLPVININNLNCINPFHAQHFIQFMDNLKTLNPKLFKVIHGDPTSSNTLIKENGDIVFIDPRGKFGNTPIFGDPCYDYAKLYYSLFGGYDAINKQKFMYHISSNGNGVFTTHNGIFDEKGKLEAQLKNLFFMKVNEYENLNVCKNFLIQSTLWFGLTGYVIEDYDAMNYAFLIGCMNYTKFLKCQEKSN